MKVDALCKEQKNDANLAGLCVDGVFEIVYSMQVLVSNMTTIRLNDLTINGGGFFALTNNLDEGERDD